MQSTNTGTIQQVKSLSKRNELPDAITGYNSEQTFMIVRIDARKVSLKFRGTRTLIRIILPHLLSSLVPSFLRLPFYFSSRL